MDDIDFATSFSPKIGALYREAKEYGRDLPGYSLNRLRGLCHLLCERVAEALAVDIVGQRNLQSKIDLVAERAHLDDETVCHLHALRVNGNMGVHPEKYFLTNQEFLEMSEATLARTRAALEAVHPIIHPNLLVPAYIVSPVVGSSLKEACYAATIMGDAESRYTLGKLFVAKAEDSVREADREAEASGASVIGFKHRSYLEQAHFWFKLAADDDHPPSMFQYGMALAQGFEGPDKESRGEHIIAMASKYGDTDAHALIGNWHLYGSKLFDIDYIEARRYLEMAAADEHPVALANLGAMHEKGWGGSVDLHAAFEYTKRSAESGYPEGQYNLFVLYLTGRGVEVDETLAIEWLTKAADQRHPVAMFELAIRISDGHIANKGLPDAEALLAQCINSESTKNRARFALARLYLVQPSRIEKVSAAANLLQRCYEEEGGNSDLARACWEESPKVVERLRQLISTPSVPLDIANEIVMACALFDTEGHPVPNRNEALRAFTDKIRKRSGGHGTGIGRSGQLPGAQALSGTPLLGRRRATPIPPLRNGPKVGRNDPCPCGSGKKSKQCCGA